MLGVALSRGSSLFSGSRLGGSSLSGSSFTLVVGEGSDIFFFFNQDGNAFAEGNILGAFGVEQSGNEAFLLHLEVDGGLVGLNASKHITGGNLISHLEVPAANVSLKKKD